jgi:pimeloyl-ACP methyl ester carboxylesterase
LDPSDALKQLRCPVFLLHGAYDDLIPPRESVELHQRLTHSHLLISPFMTHTHPSGTSLSLWQKVKAVFSTMAFCYQLSETIS